jgi:hypothetical protein
MSFIWRRNKPKFSLIYITAPLNPRFAGSNLTEDNGFLRVIKIHSITSFTEEIKLLVSCHMICGMLKNAMGMKESSHFWPSFSCFATRCLWWQLLESSGGGIRNDNKSDGDVW